MVQHPLVIFCGFQVPAYIFFQKNLVTGKIFLNKGKFIYICRNKVPKIICSKPKAAN